jgi:electron transfer flavoprotein alpha subunit
MEQPTVNGGASSAAKPNAAGGAASRPVAPALAKKALDAPIPGYEGIMVVVEQHDGQARPVSWQLLGQARRLAEKISCQVFALVLGEQVTGLAREAIAHGADIAYVCDDRVLAQYRAQPYAEVTLQVIRRVKPEIVLVGATATGRDLAGAVACRIPTGLTADCTMLDVEPASRLLLASRPAFSEKMMATILCKRHRPQMATARPGVFQALEPDEARAGQVVPVDAALDEAQVATRVVELRRESGQPRLDEAPVIVAGGRGMGGAAGFALLKELADALGGEVGATRAATEAGWVGHAHQIGQTGQTVRPKVYIACGISGAIQHMVGMDRSDLIVAINQDPNAPIFASADVGIVGDAFEVVPALIDQARRLGPQATLAPLVAAGVYEAVAAAG